MSLPDVLNRCEVILETYGKYDEVKREKAESSQDPFGVLCGQIKSDIEALKQKADDIEDMASNKAACAEFFEGRGGALGAHDVRWGGALHYADVVASTA